MYKISAVEAAFEIGRHWGSGAKYAEVFVYGQPSDSTAFLTATGAAKLIGDIGCYRMTVNVDDSQYVRCDVCADESPVKQCASALNGAYGEAVSAANSGDRGRLAAGLRGLADAVDGLTEGDEVHMLDALNELRDAWC